MSFKRPQFYRCPVCQTVVEVLEESGYELVCCGPAMQRLEDVSPACLDERHALTVTRTGEGLRVSVGRHGHPMRKNHAIRWIEVSSQNRCWRQFLGPGDLPQADFPNISGGEFSVAAYCNIHGLMTADSGAHVEDGKRDSARCAEAAA